MELNIPQFCSLGRDSLIQQRKKFFGIRISFCIFRQGLYLPVNVSGHTADEVWVELKDFILLSDDNFPKKIPDAIDEVLWIHGPLLTNRGLATRVI